jgi:hypothetical protein
MKVEPLNPASVTYISDLGGIGLDPITVITQDFAPGQGRVIVECYGMCWAAFWGSMPEGKSVIEFMASMDEYYLRSKLTRPKQTKADTEYLGRICSAIHFALRQPQA